MAFDAETVKVCLYVIDTLVLWYMIRDLMLNFLALVEVFQMENCLHLSETEINYYTHAPLIKY